VRNQFHEHHSSSLNHSIKDSVQYHDQSPIPRESVKQNNPVIANHSENAADQHARTCTKASMELPTTKFSAGDEIFKITEIDFQSAGVYQKA